MTAQRAAGAVVLVAVGLYVLCGLPLWLGAMYGDEIVEPVMGIELFVVLVVGAAWTFRNDEAQP